MATTPTPEQDHPGAPASDASNRARPGELTGGFQIGRIFGIPIYLHSSWIIIFLLITVSLGQQFTSLHPGWSPQQHWALGIITSILFFGSLLFHELSHSIVARHYRIPVQSITLYVFGGLSRISRDPSSALQEFNIAIAGPLSSLFLGGCFWLVTHYFHGNELVVAACTWLWEINVLLALFNLVPGISAGRRAHPARHRLGHHRRFHARHENRVLRRTLLRLSDDFCRSVVGIPRQPGQRHLDGVSSAGSC